MHKIISAILLPKEITQFERTYLARINRIALVFFALHVPAFTLVAWANHTGPAMAALLTAVVLIGPAAAYFTLQNPRNVSLVYGVSAMMMGGLLVHFGQGAVQIEMHFYFFALLAMCCVFGNPMVIIASTVTVALHHLIVWLTMPDSVFNYEAQWWVVGVHALFVVLEAIATCYIARSFFDNVIGLERIVKARNRDMHMLLDNVHQGFLTIDRTGMLAPERSAAVDRWFGAPAANVAWFDFLERLDPAFAYASRIAWTEVVDGFMPLELTIEQMPKRLGFGGATYSVEYRPIGTTEPHANFLVIVSDITEQLASERAADQRREVMAMFERVLADRTGVEAFIDEGQSVVSALVDGKTTDLATIKRLLHTLKGNAGLFGVQSVAELCHELEDRIADAPAAPTTDAYAQLAARWQEVDSEARRLLGHRSKTTEVDATQYAALEAAARSGNPATMLHEVHRIRLEPTSKRLRHFAEQSHRIAARLDKSNVDVRVEDHGVRLDPQRWAPFWNVFIHGVRNAIDHGIEIADERGAKPAAGTLRLATREDGDRMIVEIEDDGRGIDWDQVRERAQRHQLACSTPDQLQAALFVDGMSTAQRVTDISGRGIGMGVLRQATRALGGEISVVSRRGEGTLVRMSFPLSAADAVVALAS